ncbi:cytochrome c1 [Acetobacter sp. TBRC 12305]|uniref:Cytochrome c1 n=2 Tax=Acetobacter garciniae TaxID=2817435 RepID=A0A939KPF1_9PROT|nr:cytochrome c1 [Acetobacter garciniae]MBX0343506.1 cytochrome c1 [Acetobacter garciniae]
MAPSITRQKNHARSGRRPVRAAWIACALAVATAPTARAADDTLKPRHAPAQAWSFNGALGQFDLASVQRGYAVFAGVCASCHGLAQVHFSDLTGMGLKAEDVLALAAAWQVPDGPNAQGQLQRRNGRPDDALASPYWGPAAAKAANGGVVPPDLSRIVTVYPGGADRIYALLTGYAPGTPQTGHDFANPYAIGHSTAMPPPLHDGAVHYADGTQPTVQQQARDVTTFLAWVSAPHQDMRRRVGVGAALYLCFLALLFVILKRRIWSDVRK